MPLSVPVSAPTGPGAGKIILVVEDERVVAKDLQRSLAGLGYDVPATAASGDEALRLVSERSPALVLMDIHIKGENDGVETARILRARFDVPVYAHPWTAERIGADAPLGGGETIALADEPAAHGRPARPWRIDVLHTPGHTPGHLALYERVSGTLVAGDLVSGLSTVVVDPPEGDMAAYVASIARLAALPATLLLPGHGPPIGGPAHRLAFYLEHRAWREGRILAALADGPRALADIVTRAYDDTPPARHGIAARSALAHLLKLRAEGRAAEAGDGLWRVK